MLGSMEEQQHRGFLLVAVTTIGGRMANRRLLIKHWQLHLSSIQGGGRNCCLRRLLHQFQQDTIHCFMGVPHKRRQRLNHCMGVSSAVHCELVRLVPWQQACACAVNKRVVSSSSWLYVRALTPDGPCGGRSSMGLVAFQGWCWCWSCCEVRWGAAMCFQRLSAKVGARRSLPDAPR